MTQSIPNITIRRAEREDRSFIFSLSPILASVAKLAWHRQDTVQKFQDDYISEMLAETSTPNITLIVEREGEPLGFIHSREHTDEISGETCGTVPLLAVSTAAQGAGVGKVLMVEAENWAKKQGYRLLHLEVFANNDQAQGFYKGLGFNPETTIMIKEIE